MSTRRNGGSRSGPGRIPGAHGARRGVRRAGRNIPAGRGGGRRGRSRNRRPRRRRHRRHGPSAGRAPGRGGPGRHLRRRRSAESRRGAGRAGSGRFVTRPPRPASVDDHRGHDRSVLSGSFKHVTVLASSGPSPWPVLPHRSRPPRLYGGSRPRHATLPRASARAVPERASCKCGQKPVGNVVFVGWLPAAERHRPSGERMLAPCRHPPPPPLFRPRRATRGGRAGV